MLLLYNFLLVYEDGKPKIIKSKILRKKYFKKMQKTISKSK